jgi:hypothetical protein
MAAYSVDLSSMGMVDLNLAYNMTSTEITEVRSPSGLADILNADATLFDNQERRTMESSQPNNNLHLTVNYSKDAWGAKLHFWRIGESLSRGAYKQDTHDASGVAYPEGTADADKDGLNDSPLTLAEHAGGEWKEWTRTYKNAAGEDVTDHEWVQVFGNVSVMDLEVSYDMGAVTVSMGANNLLDVMPAKGAQPGGGNGGAFVYDGLSPFGMNGRFMYMKTSFNF